MKKYKLVKEDEHMFHIQHPDGSTFPIAKNAVGPAVHNRIKALEPVKMAEGGEVPDSSDDSSDGFNKFFGLRGQQSPLADDNSFNSMIGVNKDAGADPTFDPSLIGGTSQVPDQNQNVNSDIAQTADTAKVNRTPQSIPEAQNSAVNPLSPSAMNDPYSQAFAMKASGIQDAAGAQAQAGKEQAAAYEEQANQMAAQQAHYEQEHAKLDAEHKQIMDAVMNQKIDPNRLWNNMSTGNKVLAGIGVALSGLGAGLAGRPDLANSGMEVIQKSIDRDIDSQKMDLGKKQTLLSENVRRFGDLNTATQMTRLQMNAVTQAKIAQSAARSGSVQAQANAKVMLGELGLQAAQIKQQATIRQMAMQGGNYDPAVFVQHLVPKESRAEVFKEIKDAQNIRRGAGEALDAFDNANKEQSLFSKNAIPGVSSAYVGKIKSAVLPQFQNIDGTVRQAAMDAFLPTITPQVGDNKHTIDVKRKTLQDWIVAHSSAPTAKGYGIDLDKFDTTTTKQNQYKTVGGIKYMRGPNGEAVPVK